MDIIWFLFEEVIILYIARVLYPVKNLGPGERLGIWVSGCNRSCRGCANPELRIRKPEHQISLDNFKKLVFMLPVLPEAVTITGGEPFEQAKELSLLCEWLSDKVSNDILVYTGYTLQQLKDKGNEDVNHLLSQISALVDGEYIEELNCGNQIKGSENQKLYVFQSQYKDVYTRLDTINSDKRIIQPFMSYDGGIITTGFEKVGFNSIFSDLLQEKVSNGGK